MDYRKFSRSLYNIERWGAPYFDINSDGHVTVRPNTNNQTKIDLYELTKEIEIAGLGLPVLLRVTDILKDRVQNLCNAFEQATSTYSYHGKLHSVYPIKVNQQRTVVEHIMEQSPLGIGLEVGSKPELMIALSYTDKKHGLIICNGYKDREYIRLALVGQKMGHKIFIVVEKVSELKLIIEEAEKIQVTPNLGLRIRLSSIGKGKWQNSGGENSKFGLSSSQVLKVIETLNSHNARDYLKLIHCHLGSQLANIRDIQTGLYEISRYYAELHQLDVPIKYIDVGGGLGIDYEGSQSRNYFSMNYSIQEYANSIVHAFTQICTESQLPHPNIITESGRAMTAHHAILISNVIDHETSLVDKKLSKPQNNSAFALNQLWQTYQTISNQSAIETYHDANHWISEIKTMYTHGILDLKQHADAEQLYFKICKKIQARLDSSHQEIVDELNEKLADKYFCNISIFQSLPDIWAINQVFPIVPLHRLNEKPSKRVTLQDLTCGSDGTVSHYIEAENIETTLPAHDLIKDQQYLLGFFLVGAYQEILGDMHNLFGDTHSIDVEINTDGSYQLVEAEPGDTIREILSYIHYSSEQLLDRYQQQFDDTTLTGKEKLHYIEELKNGLDAYSYLSS